MDKNYDVDKFIECVEEYPCLWDKNLPVYMDRNCKQRAWDNVGMQMIDKWAELTMAEKRNICKYILIKNYGIIIE